MGMLSAYRSELSEVKFREKNSCLIAYLSSSVQLTADVSSRFLSLSSFNLCQNKRLRIFWRAIDMMDSCMHTYIYQNTSFRSESLM